LKSVLGQTLHDLELIVIDDGSSDNSAQLVEDLARHDKRISLLRRSVASGGPSIPKNMGLRAARSEYVCFLDQDDYYHPERLALLKEGLDKHPDWVAAFHDLQVVRGDEQPIGKTFLRDANFHALVQPHLHRTEGSDWNELERSFYIFQSIRFTALHTATVMIAPSRLLEDPPSFRKRFGGTDDADLWLRIGFQGKIGYLDRVLSYYRKHESNMSNNELVMKEWQLDMHEDNLLRGLARMTQQEQQAYRRKIADFRLTLAYLYRKAGQRKASLQECLHCIRGPLWPQAAREIVKLSLAR